MPNLRSKDNKRKSDTVIFENAKAQKLAKGAENKRVVQVPIITQLKVLKEAHEELIKVNKENVKEIEDLRIQVVLLVHERSSKTKVRETKESYTKDSQTESSSDEDFLS